MDFLREILAGSKAQGSKPNALQHLVWPIAILLTGTISSAAVGAPAWLTVLLSALLGLTLLVYLGSHCYFMWKKPDYLRSGFQGKDELDTGVDEHKPKQVTDQQHP